MSTIASNLANVLANLNAKKPDPSQDPAAALRRLRLPGKAREPYVDVVHFGASDLSVVARELDGERERLQQAATQSSKAGAALTQIEDLLKEAGDLVDANARGAGRGRRKSNQRKVDALLRQVDDIASNASAANPDLFAGRTTLIAGDASVKVDGVSREDLGRLVLNGRVLSLADIATRGGLDSARRRSAAEGAGKSIAAATETVKSLRERLQTFTEKSVRPRLGDVANALAGLFSGASGLGTSETAVKTARELRDITLAGTTAALAIGAEGWDRERLIELLT